MSNLDDFLRGYVECMLWVNAYDADTGEPVDASADYLTPGSWWENTPVDLTDAKAFYGNESPNLWATGETDFSQHGHDFALTRNHHGAGFWDRGYGPVGIILTERAEAYGEAVVYIDSED